MPRTALDYVYRCQHYAFCGQAIGRIVASALANAGQEKPAKPECTCGLEQLIAIAEAAHNREEASAVRFARLKNHLGWERMFQTPAPVKADAEKGDHKNG